MAKSAYPPVKVHKASILGYFSPQIFLRTFLTTAVDFIKLSLAKLERGREGKMIKVNMHEAKSQLSKLGKLAWQGEDIVIAKADKPYLHLVPYRKSRKQRKPDRLKGRMRIARDFDETPQEVIDSFYDGKLFPGE